MKSDNSRRARRVSLLFVVAGGLALVGCGDSGTSEGIDGGAGAATAEGDGEVVIDELEFLPASLTVSAGTEVTWVNEETPIHTIEDGDGLFDESEDMEQGDSFAFTYDEPGEYPYVCGIHPFMEGTIIVE